MGSQNLPGPQLTFWETIQQSDFLYMYPTLEICSKNFTPCIDHIVLATGKTRPKNKNQCKTRDLLYKGFGLATRRSFRQWFRSSLNWGTRMSRSLHFRQGKSQILHSPFPADPETVVRKILPLEIAAAVETFHRIRLKLHRQIMII